MGRLIVVLMFFGLCSFASPVFAQSVLEKLVMPGKLIDGHAKLENKCENCHKAFSKGVQQQLCLDCHKKVASDIVKKQGLHGRSPFVAANACKHCHTDHKGRQKNIVLLDQDVFDHRFTDFALKGSHTKATCRQCHQSKKPFRQAPGNCLQCHKKIDPHKARLKDCKTCHGEDDWKKLKSFDHSKTKFLLKAAHKNVVCASCHVDEKYKDIATTCLSCHAIGDVHVGQFGDKCETCHKTEKWKPAIFNHDRDTRFALAGKHRAAKCVSCHTGKLFQQKLPTNCFSCHKKDDAHKQQLGKVCDDCHQPSGWTRDVLFDHDLTDFPLIGLHAVVVCSDCHATGRFKDVATRCSQCHADSFHKSRLGQRCQTCHNPNGWKKWRFNHRTQTRFKLTGAHRKTACHACHKTKVTSRPRPGMACISCHQSDDIHVGRFQQNCQQCHSTANWRSSFNHDRQTRFRLTGAHRNTGCHNCHKNKNARSARLPSTCISCHGADDVHRGAFGRRCEQCHVSSSFKRVRIKK